MPELHVFDSVEDASQAAARFVAYLAGHYTDNQGRFTIALSGGATPRRLYELLASPPHSDGMQWDRWHVFWSDERCVPPDHDDSNYRMAKEALLDGVPIPPAQVRRMQGEAVPHVAAQEYEDVVRRATRSVSPSFDLILLGVGEDGHTASLFPGTLALAEHNRLVLHNWVPALQVHRITFTLPLINAAKVVAFLDTDESKAEVLRSVIEPLPGESVPPAAMVRPSSGTVHWFLSQGAAKMLNADRA